MAFGISIKATGSTGSPVRNIWDRFGELEASPSMAALNYPPHITLGVYDDISEATLCKAMRTLFSVHPKITLVFTHIAFFERPALVFYAVPSLSLELLQVHRALHKMIEPTLCREHYLPHVWVPHCTVATNVSATKSHSAIAMANRAIDHFEVVFDMADCIEFYPVRIIEETPLRSLG